MCDMVEFCKNYIKSKNANVSIKYTTALNVLEIELTSFCNCNCNNCDRLVDSAPTNDMMSIEQIEDLVRESNDLNYNWFDIRIMGGEPTLHPDIIEILKLLKTIKNYKKLRIITNGIGDKVNGVLNNIKSQNIDIGINNSVDRYINCEKINGKLHVPDYRNVLNAPVDRGICNINTCQITSTCGLGLCKYGYLPCGCGAAIGRVIGLDFFFKKLKDISVDKCNERLSVLCALCGGNLEHKVDLIHNSDVSDFWKLILDKYNKRKD